VAYDSARTNRLEDLGREVEYDCNIYRTNYRLLLGSMDKCWPFPLVPPFVVVDIPCGASRLLVEVAEGFRGHQVHRNTFRLLDHRMRIQEHVDILHLHELAVDPVVFQQESVLMDLPQGDPSDQVYADLKTQALEHLQHCDA
jgi:hypothetical protein